MGLFVVGVGLFPTQVTRITNDLHNISSHGMLVTFNVPVRDPKHADNAVAAAFEMLDTVNSRRFGGVRLRTRIGINTGLVFAGNVGSGDRYNYTVHGDAVNVASRLESLNKELGTQILVASSTVELLSESYPLSKHKMVNIKGKGRPVSVFSTEHGGSTSDKVRILGWPAVDQE